MPESRQLAATELAAALRDSRARTQALVSDLTPEQWRPPRQIGVNPVAWELAHISWFAEFWLLRGPHHRDLQGYAQAVHPPHVEGADALFDSARLPHAQRWVEAMPSRTDLDAMMAWQLDACVQAIPNDADPATGLALNDPLYFYRLALFHEDMHGEAFCWMRHALAYPAPTGLELPQLPVSTPLEVTGGNAVLGYSTSAAGFVFDNECPELTVRLADFEIDSAPLSAGAFARFVQAGGYDAAKYWPAKAGAWRAQSNCAHPRHWRRNPQGDWLIRWFDQWRPLALAEPAMHLNAFEAQAYCLWAGRRLPTSGEWEYSARHRAGFHWGHSVWEWTSDAFAPYPGFEPGPYREYSQPWFGSHRELRGGAFATHARLHNPRYRNFFEPHRTDVFAGFRTVAL